MSIQQSRALVRLDQVPHAWSAWMKYAVEAAEDAKRWIYWWDNPPLYPYGKCPIEGYYIEREV